MNASSGLRLRVATLFRAALAALLFSLPARIAQADQPGSGDLSGTSIKRLLVIDSQVGEPYATARLAMLDALYDAGYRPGKNLQVRYHSIGNDQAEGRRVLRAELPAKHDVIFINGTIAALAARVEAYGKMDQAFVYASVTDAVGVGLVDEVGAGPPANFTGVSYPVPVKDRLSFVRKLFPEARRIGLIYADMPQSQSYRRWIEAALADELDPHPLSVVFRMIPMIAGEQGSAEMARLASEQVRALDAEVDLFLSPNDQLGANPEFAEMVFRVASKPLVGLGAKDVLRGWGATASLSPSQESAGRQAARMISALFEGAVIPNIPSEWPAESIHALDLHKLQRFGVKVPLGLLDLAGDHLVH